VQDAVAQSFELGFGEVAVEGEVLQQGEQSGGSGRIVIKPDVRPSDLPPRGLT
jgi:hypothetical protein